MVFFGGLLEYFPITMNGEIGVIRYEQTGPLSRLVFPANCLYGSAGVCREEETFFG